VSPEGIREVLAKELILKVSVTKECFVNVVYFKEIGVFEPSFKICMDYIFS